MHLGSVFFSLHSHLVLIVSRYLEDGHMTTYYPDSKGITKAEIGAVSDFMGKIGLLVVCYQSAKEFWDMKD